MNKIILLFLIFYNKTKPFIENIFQQEYSVICQDINNDCQNIHNLYYECGSLLFNIWLSLDLLLSVNINFDDYDTFYNHLKYKINNIYNKIKIIKEINNRNHLLDNKKLLFYIKKIINHQIIKYNENLLFEIKKCETKIEYTL